MKFFLLFVIAMVLSSIGFKKFVWFISIGYGAAIAGIGIGLFVMYGKEITLVTGIMCLLLIVYGCRLGGYLLIREIKSTSYQKTMKTEIKDGSSMPLFVKISIWVTCALLYVCEACPVFFRLANHAPDDLFGYLGMVIMASGIILESFSDFIKNGYKKEHPHRFCDVSVFRIVRCPNYFGEVLIWTGVMISGCSILQGWLQWVLALAGWICIVYIMFGGARRLELRQNKNYGDDPEYQNYVKTVPILIPLVPLYSVAKYKWLVG